MLRACLLTSLAILLGCGGPAPQDQPAQRSAQHSASDDGGQMASTIEGARVRVIGTAQDGGLPHAACRCDNCDRASSDPSERRYVASLAIILPASDKTYVIDTTPDIIEQLQFLRDVRQTDADRVDRTPIDGVFLTHAHVGHYLGLALFGFEAVHTNKLPIYSTPAMGQFLQANQPYRQMIDMENIRLEALPPDAIVELEDGISVQAIKVPHRDELSDTVGFIVRGPRGSVLYVPDTDNWWQWTRSIEQLVASVDVSLLDGTFYSADELPGRDTRSIGHPLITDSMDRLESLVEEGKTVVFTHLNHSNLAFDPDGKARSTIDARGFAVAREGDEFPL